MYTKMANETRPGIYDQGTPSYLRLREKYYTD